MPRNRQRTTNKGSWSKENLEHALQSIQNGSTIRSAAKDFRIPFSTLQKRLRTGSTDISHLGGKPVFSAEQESKMSKKIIRLSKIFYGLTPLEVRKAAYEIAVYHNYPNKFNVKTKSAGKDWFYGFLKRNPSLSIRKPEATSKNRVTAFNEKDVSEFYDNLESIYSKHNFEASQIWNMDETGISNVQQPENIVAEKGAKRTGAPTSGERGRNVTLICAMSASGDFAPPMFVYPRKRMSELLKNHGPRGALYKCSKNGWSNSELFVDWLKHFQHHTKCTKDEPVLLILDNHVSHISLEAYYYCRENGIIMLTLVPHCSHRLQPLDVSFFGPFKAAYRKECDSFMKKDALARITHFHLAEIVNKSFASAASLAKGISGFASTGIYPLNRSVFSKEEYYDIENVQEMNLSDVPNIASIPISILNENNEHIEIIDHRTAVSPPTAVTSHASNDYFENNIDVEESPSTSCKGASSRKRSQRVLRKSHEKKDTSEKAKKKLKISPKEKLINEATETHVLPKRQQQKVSSRRLKVQDTSRETIQIVPEKKIRKKQKSTILTDSPMKEYLEKKAEKRQEKSDKIKAKILTLRKIKKEKKK